VTSLSLDDVVVRENAYTDEGRGKVQSQYSLLSSIEGTEAKEWVVGTRYFTQDLYFEMAEMQVERFDGSGNYLGQENLYEVFERAVEDQGDGTGTYIWPRQQRSDGKFFGFDQRILEEKRAKYLDKTQFRAQYYNDPHDPSEEAISNFQYYERAFLKQTEGKWYFRKNRLNVFAAMDFAFSLGKKSDFTALVVVGIDADRNYYVLDIDRFKTDKISDYYASILKMHSRWGFMKIRCEVTAAQKIIVKDLRDNYIRKYGLALSIDEYLPTRNVGTKEERIYATLEPRYANGQVWHPRGGLSQVLEEELKVRFPPHDDVKDALTSCIEVCVPPSKMFSQMPGQQNMKLMVNPRFGGMGIA
jgi:phage terminase large subunit-like protein